MSDDIYPADSTALLVIDPHNDFISDGGKVWPWIRAVAEANQCIEHMLDVLQAARRGGLRVFYALHRRYRPGDYETWKYIAPIQESALTSKAFDGYDVTMVRDATADYSDEHMRAALDINIPSYASVIVTAGEAVTRMGLQVA